MAPEAQGPGPPEDRAARLIPVPHTAISGVQTSPATQRFARRFELVRKELEMISPISTLEKGYAIVQNRENGELVRVASTQKVGSKLRIRVFKGALDAEVEEIVDEEL